MFNFHLDWRQNGTEWCYGDLRVQFTEDYADYPHYADYADNADNLKHHFCVNNT